MFKNLLKFILLVNFIPMCLVSAHADTAQTSCHYSTYQWNVQQQKAVNYKKVSKLKTELRPDEIDTASGCSVCEEDQTSIQIAGLNPFTVCKKLAPDIERVLTQLLQQGQPVIDVIGYRVGMTRGDVDKQGNRTQFSNHSFGVAIDINTNQNGLYDNCIQWNPKCRLIKGGTWNPADPRSWTSQSLTVILFKQNGFLWGGEIKGNQKDFMHFSLTGY